jgi:hypothetical protein
MRTVLIRKYSRKNSMCEPFGLATGALGGARDNPVSAATSRADGHPVPPARKHRQLAESQRAVNPPSITNSAPVTNADSWLSR